MKRPAEENIVDQWERAKSVFCEALDLSESEREHLINIRCRDDNELREDVMSLLEAHAGTEAFIEAPAFAPMSSLVEDDTMPSRIGTTVGSYKIEEEIGRGGMGAVFLATRADQEFEKKVAIKLIKRGFDTDEIIGRFRHERQILAALEHPNITRLLDGGSTEDGLPFLVMDYVDGKPLNVYSDEHQLSIEQRLGIFLQVCSSVSYAHQNLIIHRDLKPSNILVIDEGVPKLLDFGIAKLTVSNGGAKTIERTISPLQAMTPDYASPEQVAGRTVTTSTDIYSLGVILYELLTGHRPYQFRTSNVDEISRKHSDTSPTKPSSICRVQGLNVMVQNPDAVVRKLRGDLDNIILMAMRNEPERRYSSVEQFADDIRRYLAGRPVIALDDTFLYRTSKFVKRNKAGVAAGIGIAASLVGGLIVSSRQARIAAQQRDRARREEQKAQKVSQFLQNMLASADPRHAGKPLQVPELLNIAAKTVETEFGTQPEVAADLYSSIGLTYLSLGHFEAAETCLKLALDTRTKHFPDKSVEVALSLSNYAKVFHAKGDFKTAEPMFDRALEILRGLKGERNLDVADVLDKLAHIIAIQGNHEEAIRLRRQELEIKRNLLGEDHPDVANSLSELASVLSVMGRHGAAEDLKRRALSILHNVHGTDHPDIAELMGNLILSVLPRDVVEAEQLSRETLSMRRRLLGDDHPDVAWSLYVLAYVLVSAERFEEAEGYVKTVLVRRGTNLPDEHPVISSSLMLQGRILIAKRLVNEARVVVESCLELRRLTLPPDHWLLATTQSLLGECLYRLGEIDQGERLLVESRNNLSNKLGESHEQTQIAAKRVKNCVRT